MQTPMQHNIERIHSIQQAAHSTYIIAIISSACRTNLCAQCQTAHLKNYLTRAHARLARAV